MESGATEAQLDQAENELGVRLPSELRSALSKSDGSESWSGEVFLVQYGVAEIVEVNLVNVWFPDLLVFASDGSREYFGLDLTIDPPPVVMTDLTSGRESAILQANSLAEFMQQRVDGEDFRWGED